MEREALTVEQVHTQVRDSILQGELPAGAAMSQVQLARELGVGRTPLREALRMLQREGLVTAEYNRQIRVADISVADLEQLYAMVLSLETLAIRLTVPRMAPKDLCAMDKLLIRLEEFSVAGDVEGWQSAHEAFHRQIVMHAGSRILRTLDELADHSGRYRRVYLPDDAGIAARDAVEHAEIAEACRDRNPCLAAERLARHFGRTALMVLLVVSPEHEPATVRAALRAATGSCC